MYIVISPDDISFVFETETKARRFASKLSGDSWIGKFTNVYKRHTSGELEPIATYLRANSQSVVLCK